MTRPYRIRIFLADDHAVLRAGLRALLNAEADMEVVGESGGDGGCVDLILQANPDLVLLDINMPGVDGTEILAFLRREPRLVPVPVIIITSDDQPETRQRVMQGGANAVVIKPAAFDTLEAAMKKVGIV